MTPPLGTSPLMKLMRLLQLRNEDASRFLLLFEDMDTDHNGIIDLKELVAYTKQDASLMLHVMRRVSDAERFRYIEVFVAVYNFNTLDRRGLVRFAFDMLTKTDVLKRSDVEAVVRDLLKVKERKVQAKVDQLMFFLDQDGSGGVDFEEFWRLHSHLSLLLFPVIRLQQVLRKNIFGGAYWRQAVKRVEALERDTGYTTLEVYAFSKQQDASDLPTKQEQPLEEETVREEDTMDDVEPGITVEEAEDLVAQAEDDANEHAKAVAETGAKLRAALAPPSSASSSRKVAPVDDDAAQQPQQPRRREGRWWIEAPENDDDELRFGTRKSLVTADTADILVAADQSRLRAARLDANAPERARLIQKDARAVIPARKISTRWRRTCSCCCSRRVAPKRRAAPPAAARAYASRTPTHTTQGKE